MFFKAMVTSVLLRGNAYAYIERDAALRVSQLVYVPSGLVTIVWVTDKEGVQRKRYQVSPVRGRIIGDNGLVHPRDMIHVLNFSYDGIIGVSTLTHARQTLGLATDSEQHAAGFLHNGNTSGILTVKGVRLKKEQKDQIYKTWNDRINNSPGGIIILEDSEEYKPITINPKDSQLLESRQFNVVDICRFFSVSPVKAFDLSKSSYSTLEATQLAYLAETVQPFITKIELEINRKVFLPSERKHTTAEFDVSVLLRTDRASQATYNNAMVRVGAKTINEVRRDNNLPRLPDGDNPLVEVNMQTLSNAVRQPVKTVIEEKK
ncbi:phage portal protein, HK97 family [Bacteroidales bacterium Barb6]|nr:phage portal protein, HK97 family [Bacteroidales bacterium Barb6]